MPLSEEEQRMLEQLEHALAAEDPKFASTLRGSRARSRHRRVAVGAGCVFVLGIVLLMTGVILKLTLISVAGFGFMLGGAYFGLTAWRRSTQPEPLYVVGSGDAPKSQARSRRAGRSKPASKPRQQRSASSGSFMERLEERWRRRRESGY